MKKETWKFGLIIGLILAFILLGCSSDLDNPPRGVETYEGSGTAQDPYLVGSETALRNLFSDLGLTGSDNDYNPNGFYYIEQTTDITLTQPWEPVASATDESGTISGGFHGVYDGQHHTISNMAIDITEEAIGTGFFSGLVGSDSAVKNLKLTGVSVKNTNGESSVGALVGIMGEGASISNITISGTEISGIKYVGGVVGKIIKTGTISNVVNNAPVSGSVHNIGGIVGAAYYDQAKDRTSNPVLEPFIIENVRNNGTVNGPYAVGGIVGLARTVDIKNATNTAAITGSGPSIGGISGEFGHGSTIDTAQNSGDIQNNGSGTGTGGIVGWIRYNDAGNYNKTINSTVKNAHNTGSITTSGAVTGVGGVVGMIYWAGTIEDSSNNASITNTTGNMTGGIIGSIQWLSDGNAQASNIILINRNIVKAQSTVTSSGGNKHSFVGHVVMPESQGHPLTITFTENDTGIPVIDI